MTISTLQVLVDNYNMTARCIVRKTKRAARYAEANDICAVLQIQEEIERMVNGLGGIVHIVYEEGYVLEHVNGIAYLALPT